jgi:transposase
MDVIYERCCGLDVHKNSVVACLLLSHPQGEPARVIRTFGTMTEDLLALADWLAEKGCTHVAMESTGVYWKPIWNLLEDAFSLLLVNPRDSKAVPGRKTDVTDAEWIADLLRHGLLRSSYVPDRPQRELRELTRYRTSLVRERTAEANRLQKTLEGANIKLASVATDILGKSGRIILQALVAGAEDTATLAQLAQGRLREKIPQLERALAGRVDAHQRFMLTEHLAQIDFLETAIARVSAEIAERLRPVTEAVERLDTIPGIGQYLAEALIAEIGTDMSRFPPAAHLASWAGMCPGNHESAGKRRSGRTRKGSPWLRALLVQAAHAGARKKDTPTSGRSTADWPRAAGRAEPPWRLGIPFSSSPTTYCATAPAITISGPATSTSATVEPWNVASCPVSKAWATRCPCNRQLRAPREEAIFRPRWVVLRT